MMRTPSRTVSGCPVWTSLVVSDLPASSLGHLLAKQGFWLGLAFCPTTPSIGKGRVVVLLCRLAHVCACILLAFLLVCTLACVSHGMPIEVVSLLCDFLRPGVGGGGEEGVEARFFWSVYSHQMNHDIVDSLTHASCMFGHNPHSRVSFSTLWGVVNKELPFTQQLIIGTSTPSTPKIQLVGSNIN